MAVPPYVPAHGKHDVRSAREPNQSHHRRRRLDLDRMAVAWPTGGNDSLGKGRRRARLHACDRSNEIDQGGEIIRRHVEDRSAARFEQKFRVWMPVLHPVRHQEACAGEYPADSSCVDKFARQTSSSAEKGIRRAPELEAAPFSLSDERAS